MTAFSYWNTTCSQFTDLDMRLRSLVQKAACPTVPNTPPPTGRCDPTTQTGCDRALNEVRNARIAFGLTKR